VIGWAQHVRSQLYLNHLELTVPSTLTVLYPQDMHASTVRLFSHVVGFEWLCEVASFPCRLSTEGSFGKYL